MLKDSCKSRHADVEIKRANEHPTSGVAFGNHMLQSSSVFVAHLISSHELQHVWCIPLFLLPSRLRPLVSLSAPSIYYGLRAITGRMKPRRVRAMVTSGRSLIASSIGVISRTCVPGTKLHKESEYGGRFRELEGIDMFHRSMIG